MRRTSINHHFLKILDMLLQCFQSLIHMLLQHFQSLLHGWRIGVRLVLGLGLTDCDLHCRIHDLLRQAFLEAFVGSQSQYHHAGVRPNPQQSAPQLLDRRWEEALGAGRLHDVDKLDPLSQLTQVRHLAQTLHVTDCKTRFISTMGTKIVNNYMMPKSVYFSNFCS